MKLKWLVFGVVAVLLAAPVGAEEATVLKTPQDKLSYGIGISMAKNLKRQGIEVNQELLLKGIRDELSGGKTLMSEEDLRASMLELRKVMQENRAKINAAAAETNKKEGEAFLAKNQKAKGVVTLKDGLQYKIVKAAKGKKPGADDTVEVNYRGTLINGKEFDKSQPDHPVSFKVKQVIPGWQEALKLMPVGSKWQIFIPPALAYGERSMGPNIGPNSTLIFDVELVAIK